ncbi:hypothetical protein [Aequorivita marina]|uniref:hypothetical protein n=1 Tax=Aequorivita marina TaxID=3073654 RepID=UPI0028750C66|nr:hypothetical protein [Aequorivita sp. S2608]MDS1299099.1 hypothetical protein [Aequorivita sp. S2608]
METLINKFWNCFLAIQSDLLHANSVGNTELRNKLFGKLYAKVIQVNPGLQISVLFASNFPNSSSLIFIVKGNYRLKALVNKVLIDAPQLKRWQYQMGIKPYEESLISLCSKFNFLGAQTIIYEIYFAVSKVYKTSNKLHLMIYLETDRKFAKADLRAAMDNIFLWFLGDTLYYRHISQFKIVRRKFSRINFIPLDELRSFIGYKH